jgi:hypothetical protein
VKSFSKFFFLKEFIQRDIDALGASPRTLEATPDAIATKGVFTNKKGVTGALPLGCFPLWGREGVTLILFLKEIEESELRKFFRIRKWLKKFS